MEINHASQETAAETPARRLSAVQAPQGRASGEVPTPQRPEGAASSCAVRVSSSNVFRSISPSIAVSHAAAPLDWSQNWSHRIASAVNRSGINTSAALPSLPWAQGSLVRIQSPRPNNSNPVKTWRTPTGAARRRTPQPSLAIDAASDVPILARRYRSTTFTREIPHER